MQTIMFLKALLVLVVAATVLWTHNERPVSRLTAAN